MRLKARLTARRDVARAQSLFTFGTYEVKPSKVVRLAKWVHVLALLYRKELLRDNLVAVLFVSAEHQTFLGKGLTLHLKQFR
jgi:hypothetical protein